MSSTDAAAVNVFGGAVPKRRRWVKAAASVGAIAVLVAGGAALTRGGDAAPQTASRHVDVYFDGWSALLLPKGQVTLTVESAAGAGTGVQTPDGEDATVAQASSQDVVLQPLSASDLEELGGAQPDLVRRAAARLLSVDPALTCSSKGCSAGSQAWSPAQMADLPTVAGLGSMYRGYGAQSLLAKATVEIPSWAQNVVVSAPGFGDRNLFLTWSDDVAGEDPAAGEDLAGDPVAGYGRGQFLIGAAFGRFFHVDPAWVEGGEGVAPFYQSTQKLTGGSSPVQLWRGLGYTDAGMPESATASLLSWLSSPATGCGGAVCVPGVAKVEAKVVASSTPVVCLPTDQGVAKIKGLVRDIQLTVNYPAPTSQLGLWNGKSPAQFDGAAAGAKGLWSGTPPLVQGSVSWRALAVTAAGPAADGSTRLAWMTGRFLQQGFDSAYTEAKPDYSGALSSLGC